MSSYGGRLVNSQFYDPSGAWEAFCKVCQWSERYATEPEASQAMKAHYCPSGRRAAAGVVSRVAGQPMSDGRRSISICSVCDADRTGMLNGIPFCDHHYWAAAADCTDHQWVMDSTEVFNTSKGPVIRAFYFCLTCGAGAITKPGEEPREAQHREARDSLLRAQQLLEDEDGG